MQLHVRHVKDATHRPAARRPARWRDAWRALLHQARLGNGLYEVPDPRRELVQDAVPRLARTCAASWAGAYYYRKFVQHFSIIAVHLTTLCRTVQLPRILYVGRRRAAELRLAESGTHVHKGASTCWMRRSLPQRSGANAQEATAVPPGQALRAAHGQPSLQWIQQQRHVSHSFLNLPAKYRNPFILSLFFQKLLLVWLLIRIYQYSIRIHFSVCLDLYFWIEVLIRSKFDDEL